MEKRTGFQLVLKPLRCSPSSESERGPGKVVNRRIQCQGELAAIAEQYHYGTPHTVTLDQSSASAVDPLRLTSTTTVLDNCSGVLCPLSEGFP